MRLITLMDAGGLKPNTWQRLKRLSSVRNQAKLGVLGEPDDAANDEPGVVAKRSRRAKVGDRKTHNTSTTTCVTSQRLLV